jgi:ribonuclease E
VFEADETGAVADTGEAEGSEGETAVEGAADEEASADEPRKRRRGRRGGKRNRRDQAENADDVQDEATQGDEAPSVEAEAAKTDTVVSETPVVEAAVADTETVAEEAAPQPAEAEKPKKPARRTRKAKVATSEQPALVNGEDPSAKESTPEAGSEAVKNAKPEKEEAPAEPVVVSSTTEEAKPRKTGWWQRKSFF